MAINIGCDIINPMNLTTLAKTKRYRKAIKNAVDKNLISEKVAVASLGRVYFNQRFLKRARLLQIFFSRNRVLL